MAYVQVEADDVSIPFGSLSIPRWLTKTQQRLEEGPEGLQFKCMLTFAHS